MRAAEGEVTEVLGDGLVALFEAPNLQQAVRGALEAALAVKARTRALNGRRRQRHDPIVVNMGLGAGRGEVAHENTGTSDLLGRLGEWVEAGDDLETAAGVVAAAVATAGGAGQHADQREQCHAPHNENESYS